MAHLDGVRGASGELSQERVEGIHPLDGEVGRELEEQGTEPVIQALHRTDEVFGGVFAVDEVLSCVISWEFLTLPTNSLTLTMVTVKQR